MSGIGELVQKIKNGAERLTVDVVEAMTTNETFFFRDKVPFDHVRDTVLPQLLKVRANRKSLRIWCAASSTGQEPYSLAMLLKDMLPAGWRAEIVATDLSLEVLEKAKAGIYTQFEVQRGLPIQLLVKHFKQVGDVWQLNPDIRAMVRYQQANLLQDFSHLGIFDIIFCRNVLIYFDQPTKIDVFGRMQRISEPDGYLFLGAAETVIGLTDAYRACPDLRGVYAPNPVRTSSPSLVPGLGMRSQKVFAAS
jgi:chemotaxis protein methyltransferase CheR